MLVTKAFPLQIFMPLIFFQKLLSYKREADLHLCTKNGQQMSALRCVALFTREFVECETEARCLF